MKKIARNFQKKISGGTMLGDEGLGEGGGHTRVECTTPNGTEGWRRRCDNWTDATRICQSIYPAYGDRVTGQCVYVIVAGQH